MLQQIKKEKGKPRMLLQIEKGKKKGLRGRRGDDAHSVSVLADFGVHRRSMPLPLPPPWHQSETPKAQVAVANS
ncbi:hypothetical protein ES319_A05G217500v1 [Gossypium barbadense]|uniref:Uncharacterized protein n=1 Tax=Gossypium barbadense TaxID=3634 RepID=A0A5J5VRL7_GOSBA|nr:hypothetical protein ES319_A05G217500v1 [Gossypium barbadense]